VFVELRTVSAKGLKASVDSALDRLGFSVSDGLFDHYAGSGNLVLLLDGFDELEQTLVPETMYELQRLAERYEKLQILVSARPGSAIQHIRRFNVVRLMPLSSADQRPFLERIGVASLEVDHLLSAIQRSSDQLGALLTTPLMLTLLVVMYRVNHDIPPDLPSFYEQLFQTLFVWQDASKSGPISRQRCDLTERQLQCVFEAFCFATIELGFKSPMTLQAFGKAFDRARGHLTFACEEQAFRHEVTEVSGLMQQERSHIHFIHKSVVEFYAASSVRSLSEESARGFYEQLLGRSHYPWRQVLNFLSQIDRCRHARYFELPLIEHTFDMLMIDPDHEDSTDVRHLLQFSLGGVRLT